MEKELAKAYAPGEFEDRLYQFWESNNYFHAEVDPDKKPYTIMMPPPNITGQLHMGHALDNTLQDILIRFKRMQGYSALWLPGTDHASIATEAKIVEAMRKEGLTKEAIGREKFLERAWDWKKEYGGRIVRQLRKMGSSADWVRERFTMDEGCSKAVKNVFVKLYDKGLIYRGERIINWCPKCLTSISDAEVEYEEQAGHFWHLRYALSDGSGYINLATTRPETLLGDTAVAVNPNDDRYRHLVGKTVILPLVHREIPIVADDYVEMDFGTGVVKITPAHDPNDFEVGLRHQLPVINVMTDDAKITEDYPKYAGMDRYEARKAIVADLEEEGALVRVEDYTHNVGTCYRCSTTVEPRVSKQWFVKMKPLAGPAIDAVKNGETRFVPPHFEKTYFHWLENIRDWCISRQLWWGHQIPAFYCDDCGETVVTADSQSVCPRCGKPMRQDPDTLDTWFSSALWPFSTLGWPDETKEMNYFYPTSVLVTGYDIIPFWVMRMMFSGIEHTGKAPFDTVLIHGLVRDALGRKMSKSLGNGIDPLEIIDNYGADALRFSLVMGISPGNDTRYSTEKVEMARNFANKVWNASRFVLMNMGDTAPKINRDLLTLEDKWILTRCTEAVRQVTENFDNADYGLAAQKIYDFAWSEFCDWYIELSKSALLGEDEARKNNARAVLLTVLSALLRLLHPLMPYVTEEVFSYLPGQDSGSCMLSAWPEADASLEFPDACAKMEAVMEMVRSIRNLRSGMNVQPGHRARLMVRPAEGRAEVLLSQESTFRRLAAVSKMSLLGPDEKPGEKTVSAVCAAGEFFIPLGELVDLEAEKKRLNKEKDRIEGEIRRGEGKLSNPGFIGKAPAQLVESEKAKLETNRQMLAALEKQIAELEQ